MTLKRFAIGLSFLTALAIAAPEVRAAEDDNGDGGLTITNAQGQGWYAFGSIGGSNGDVDANNLYPQEAVAGVDIDREDLLDFAWGAGGGWRFNDHFAVEVGWLDLGEYSGSFQSGSFSDGREVGFDGVRARVLGYYAPSFLNPEEGSRLIELVGGLGFLVYDTSASASCSLPGDTNPDCLGADNAGREPKTFRSQDDSGESFNISVGAQVNFTQGTALRVAYDHFFDVSGVDIDAVMVDFVFSYRGMRELLGVPIKEKDPFGYY